MLLPNLSWQQAGCTFIYNTECHQIISQSCAFIKQTTLTHTHATTGEAISNVNIIIICFCYLKTEYNYHCHFSSSATTDIVSILMTSVGIGNYVAMLLNKRSFTPIMNAGKLKLSREIEAYEQMHRFINGRFTCKL